MSIRPMRYDDQAALVGAATTSIKDAIREAVADHGRARVVIAGGRVIEATCAQLRHATGMPWEDVEVWFADERWTEEPEDRNDLALGEKLFDHVDAHLHPMPAPDGVTTPDEAAAAYAASLPERVDVSILSIGEDGHIASLFPHHAVLDATDPVAVVTGSPKPPPVRLTLTAPVLLAAATTFVLVSGEGKASALAAIEGGSPVVETPGAMLTDAQWLVDADAAGG